MATITIRLDDNLKNNFAKTCDDMGMDMTTAFTIFAKKVSREKRIPFEVSADPFYSERNMKAIKDSIEQLNSGKVVVKSMAELENMEQE